MANSLTTQTILDGPRNQVEKDIIYQDTSNFASTVLSDPSTWNYDSTSGFPKINFIDFAVEDGMTVDLYWDATTPVFIASLNGRGEIDARKYSGLPNNGGTGATGKVLFTTNGWATGLIQTATLEIEYRK